MSYILDSLKKAEQQRREQAAVDVPVQLQNDTGRRKRRTGLIVLAVAILLAASVGGVLLLDRLSQPSVVAGGVQRPAASRSGQQPAGGKRVTKAIRPVATRSGNVAPSPVQPALPVRPEKSVGVKSERKDHHTPASLARAKKPRNEILAPEQLPSRLREQAFRLRLTMHYFVKDPARRLVRLEGRMLREGESLPDGLKVDRIERAGVVLAMDGYRFRLPKP